MQRIMKYLMKSTLDLVNMNCSRNNNNNSFEKKVKIGLEDFKNKHFLNDAVLKNTPAAVSVSQKRLMVLQQQTELTKK